MTALTLITPANVSTPADRKNYLEFLKTHPNISPIQKLFGLHAAPHLEPSEVTQQARSLMLRIHPDKVNKDEEEICREIFQIIREAEKHVVPEAVSLFALLPSGSLSSPFVNENNPIEVLDALVRAKKWFKSKKFAESIQETDPEFRILLALVHLHLNDLSATIDYLPQDLVKTRTIIRECQEAIAIKKLSNLTVALDQARQLRTVYTKEWKAGYPEPLLLKEAVPYKLFVELKELYKATDPLSYECQLRNAIRFCPSGAKEEKHALIDELFKVRTLPTRDYSFAPIEKAIADRQQYVWIQPKELVLSRTHQQRITKAIATKKPDQLALASIQILEEEKKWCLRFLGMIVYVISIRCFCDWHSNSYYNQIRSPLNQWLALAQGFDLFSKAKEPKPADILAANSAQRFKKADDLVSYGLVKRSQSKYRSAISSWCDYSKNAENLSESEKETLHRYAYEVMDLNDTLQIDEAVDTKIELLGEVDDFQREVLQSMRK